MKRLVLNLLRARMMKGMSTKKAVTGSCYPMSFSLLEYYVLFTQDLCMIRYCFESGDGLFLLMLLGLSVYAISILLLCLLD